MCNWYPLTYEIACFRNWNKCSLNLVFMAYLFLFSFVKCRFIWLPLDRWWKYVYENWNEQLTKWYLPQGKTALHTACQQGLSDLTLTLLEKGSNPNAQTLSSLDSRINDESAVFRQTPLHLAITNKHSHVVKVFLEYKGYYIIYPNSEDIINIFITFCYHNKGCQDFIINAIFYKILN
jgi:hypothetical protein